MLIAESGSTKTEWRFITQGEIRASFRSPGVNPNVLSPQAIQDILSQAFENNLPEMPPGEVFFYGAGMRGEQQSRVMTAVLKRFFPNSRIFVELDILAAARSTRREEGIICILGTGSNSALHKSQQIVSIKGGLGYLFGDEGSGMDLGRHLVKGMLQEDFPSEVQEFVEHQTGKSLSEIRLEIHHSPKPNVKMAELSRLLGDLRDIPAVKEMIVHRFIAFIDTTVCRYPEFSQLWIDFAGSVSYFFRDLLGEACQARKIRLGEIVKDPIDKLVEFHKTWSPG